MRTPCEVSVRSSAGGPESRARETTRQPEVAPKPLRQLHPDQLELVERLQDTFSRALGADVRVAPRKEGYTVTLSVESLAEAEALAERLSFRAAAGD